jgi:purine-binding chemotaxis protein CheW
MTASASTPASADPPTPTTRGGPASEIQLVVFELGDERYGLDIAAVYEIIRHQPITAVPQAPAFVAGVINLRGRIIPVIDLRGRFAMPATDLTKASRIVVCEASGTRVGLMVDGVSEVLMVSDADIDETPDVTVKDAAYLRGIAKLGDRLVILLDLDGLFGELGAEAVAASAA